MANLPDGWVLDEETPAASAPRAPTGAKLPDGWIPDEEQAAPFVPVPTPRPAYLDAGVPLPPKRPGNGGDLPADLNAPGAQPDQPAAPAAPGAQPGMMDTMLEAGRRGLVQGLTDTGNVLDPFKERQAEQPTDAVGKLLQTPMSNGWRNPNWWAAHIANGFAASAPTLAMTMGGATAGGMVAGPGGALAGGMGGGAIGAAMQTLAPAYAKARQDGLDHDAAVNRAIDETGIASVFGAGMAAAPELKIFGTDALGAVKKPISEALAQIFGVQPGLMGAQKVTENAREGKDLTEGVGESVATGIATGAAQAGIHAGASKIPLPKGFRVEADTNAPAGGPPPGGADAGPQPAGPAWGDKEGLADHLTDVDEANRTGGPAAPESYTTPDGKTYTPTDPDIQAGLRAARRRDEAYKAQQQAQGGADQTGGQDQQKGGADAAGAGAAPNEPPPPGGAPGGAAADDTGQNMPESKATLQAQQDQLVNGDRRAQMFPTGTEELPLPKGMKRVKTPRGVFHYDPSKITPDEIKKASAAGRENDILDLGPNSKADVDAAAAQGDPRVNVTERGPNGEEVKTSTATEGTADAQAETMEQTKTEGNTVQKEPIEKTIQERENATLRAMGWADADIGKMSPLERQAQLQEAHESGVTANDEPAPGEQFAENAKNSKGDGTKDKPTAHDAEWDKMMQGDLSSYPDIAGADTPATPASAVTSGKDAHGNEVVNFGSLSIQLHGSGFGGGQHIFVKHNGKEYSFDKQRDGRKGGYQPSDLPDTTIPAPLHPIIADFVNGKITRAEMVERLKGVEKIVREGQKKPGTREAPIKATEPEHVDAAAAQAEQPTPAQAAAGNYKKGHLIHTALRRAVAIETPKGEERHSKEGEEPKWVNRNDRAHYGYIKGTKGADGDPLDIYIGPKKENGKTFVVDQHDPKTGKFDEHKIITGVDSVEEAAGIYNAGFSDGSGPKRMGAITETNVDHLNDWIDNGDKKKPFGKEPEQEAALPPGAERENLFAKDSDPGFLKDMSPQQRADFEKGNDGNKSVAIKIGHAIDNLKAKDPNHPRIKSLEEKLQGVLNTIMPGADTSRRGGASGAGPRSSWQDDMRKKPGANAQADARKKESPAEAARQTKAFTDNGWSPEEAEDWLRKAGHSDAFARDVGRRVHDFWQRQQREAAAAERAEREKESPAYAEQQAQEAAKTNKGVDETKDDLRSRGHNERFVEQVGKKLEGLYREKDAAEAKAKADAAEKKRADELAEAEARVAKQRAAREAAEKAEAEKPIERVRTWDATPADIEKASRPGLHKIAREKAVLKAWVTQLSDADWQKLAKWGLYDFPRVLGDTMEPARLLDAYQRSLKEDKPVHLLKEEVEPGIIDRVAKELTGEAPKGEEPKAEEPKRDVRKPIGKNRNGHPVYEDENGVRSYVEKGVRVTEPVGIVPGGGMYVDKENRSKDYKTEAELGGKPTARTHDAGDPVNEIGSHLMAIKSGGMVRPGSPLLAFLNENGLVKGKPKAWKEGQGLELTPEGERVRAAWKGYGEVPEQAITDLADRWQAMRDAAEESPAAEKPAKAKKPKKLTEDEIDALERQAGKTRKQIGVSPDVADRLLDEYSNASTRTATRFHLDEDKGVLNVLQAPNEARDDLSAYKRVATFPLIEGGTPVNLRYPDTDLTPNHYRFAEEPEVDTAKPSATNEAPGGKEKTNADDGAGVRPDAPGVSKDEQPAVAGESPEFGAAPGTLGEGGSGRGPDVRHPSGADDARADAPEGVSRPGKGARGDTGDGGRDRKARDRVSAAADDGRVEAEKSLADRARRNYVIDPNDDIGAGGPKTKVRQNLDAIRIVKEIIAEQREPTAEEKDKLARYVGWGAFAQKLFDPDRNGRNADDWKAERTELRSLLTPEEYAAARASTLNAHYTSVPVIQGMWKAAESLGYRGGRAIEPSAGVGSFIGLTPEGLRNKTMWTAVELDPITGHIAKALYGGADVNVKGFQDLVRPDNYFDLAISNVPFGSYGIRDTRYGRPDLLIHDYFFVKSLDKVRPGGMVAFVTSAGTMNKAGDRARQMIQDRADLVGAVRLPGGRKGAFAGNAGTEVTTDILFLRKRAPGEPRSTLNPWNEVKEIQTKDGPATINEYFVAHPEHVLGTHALSGTMYRADTYTVEPFEGSPDYPKLIADAAASFPAELRMTPRAAKTAERPKQKGEDLAADDVNAGVKEGGFFEKGGKLYRKEGGVGKPAELKGPDEKKVRALTKMRDLVNTLLNSQATGEIAGNDAARKDLKKQYAAFVKEHGPINLETHTVTSRLNRQGENVVITKMPNFNAFRGDPDAYKVAAIEDYDSTSGTARPAAIMERDIVGVPTERKIESPADAMAASLEAHGGLNEPYIARTLGIDLEHVEKALGDLAFRDPNGDRLVPVDEYLSGDVVQKLEEAQALADVDPRMARNIEALKKVQPTPLRTDEITAQFGAPWIPEDVLQHFLEQHLGGHGVSIKRQPLTAEWQIESSSFAPDARAKYSTNRVGLEEVIKAALNMRRLSVYDHFSDGTRALNAEATRLANVKLDELRDAFSGNDESGTDAWVWKDRERAARVAALYNRKFNSTAKREFDGSHLTFPGMASHIAGADGQLVPFSLRKHQADAVWRILQRGNTLLDHVVGAGKTYTIVAAAMEGRRLGLFRKPTIVVPNHMLEQFSREFLQAYPGAKLLVAQKDEMTKDARRAFAAKASTGDWDSIVITHDAFGRINMSPEWQAQHIAKQVAQMEDLIREMKGDRASDKRTVKQVENAKLKLQARIQNLMNAERKDQGVTFEEMGIDHIFLDEAHLFKNLSFVTKMTRVKGLAQGNAQRAEDMYLKIKWLEQNKPGRSAVFATGTPISNTIAEMFTMQRYLQEDRLAQMGLDKFDSWAQTFGQTQEQTELSADGRSMKTVTSFSKFVNIPELVGMYAEIADTQTADMLNLPRPQLAKNERGERGITAVKSQPSPEEEALIQSFVHRAQTMKGPAVKGGDNMLKVVTDGRKVATDGRLYDPNLPFNPNGKIAKMVENIMKHYRGAKAPALAQIVFLDMGTPKPPQAAKKPTKIAPEDELGGDDDAPDEETMAGRMNLYEDLRQRLIAEGIPKKEVAFIHEATDDRKKAALFEKVRRGEVRVLVGSTGKMGVGTNVQRMLIAMHHGDAPYKPAEVEQRDGRGLRQGNLNKEIHIYRYVTERSFDAFMWQKLDTKSKFIAQLKSGSKGVRTAEDIDNPLPEAAEMKAAASGDPRIMEEANLTRVVQRLETQRKSFQRTQQELDWRKKAVKETISHAKASLPEVQALAGQLKDVSGDNFSIDLSGMGLKKPITDRAEAGEAIKQFFTTDASKFMGREAQGIRLGNYGGMELYADAQRTWTDDGYSTTIQPYVKSPSRASGRFAARQRTFINETSDLGGFTRQLDTILGDIKREPEHIKASIAGNEEDLARLESENPNAKWPREAEYAEATKKLKELREALKAKGEPAKPADGAKPDEMASAGLGAGHNGGPTLDDLTEHARQHIEDVIRDVREIVGRVAGNHANALKFENGKFAISQEAMKASAGEEGHLAAGSFTNGLRLIRVALGVGGERSTAYHEAMHALERGQAFTPEEMRVLEAETPRLRERLRRKFGISQERMNNISDEEVRAYSFEDYANGRTAGDPAAGAEMHVGIRRVFERIMAMLRRIKDALLRRGFGKAEDVFKKAYDGEMGERPARGDGAGLSVGEVRDYIRDNKMGARFNMDDLASAGMRQHPNGAPRHFYDETLRERIMRKARTIRAEAGTFIKEKFQDYAQRMLDKQREVQDAKGGGQLPQTMRFYDQKRLTQARTKAKMDEFLESHLQPLLDVMKEEGLTRQDVAEYAFAKHAPERNAEMDRRDPNNNGAGSGKTDAEAADMLRELGPNMVAVMDQRVAPLLQRIRDFNLDNMVRGGLLSQEQADEWRARFPNYVGLQGFEDANLAPDDQYFREGRKMGVFGKESKTAFGRNGTMSGDPVVNLIQQSLRTIDRVERNKVGMAAWRAFRSLPNQIREDMGVRLDEGDSQKVLDPKTGLMQWRTNSPTADMSRVFSLKIGGQPHHIVFEDARVADAFNRMGADRLPVVFKQAKDAVDVAKGLWTHWVPDFVTRHFGFRYPIEAVLNAGEFGGAAMGRALRGLPGGAPMRAILAAEKLDAAGRTQVAQRFNAGTATPSERWQHFYLEGKKAGAVMDLNALADLDSIKRYVDQNIAKLSDPSQRADSLFAKAKAVHMAWDRILRALDNAHRLVQYVDARERGEDVTSAALKARDATVDFAMRGQLANWINLWWPFGNTAIQTSARMLGAIGRRSPQFLAYSMGGSFAAGLLSTLFNYLFGGEDKDGAPNIENVPDYVRRLNLTLVLPGTHDKNGDPYKLTIPLPYNYAMATTLGQLAGHGLMKAAGYAKEATSKVAMMTLHSVLEGLMAMPQEDSLMGKAVPQVFIPGLHIYGNQTFYGAPLYTQYPKDGIARAYQGRPNTSPLWKGIAETANDWTGGSKYESGWLDGYPEAWREGAGYFTSGLERFGNRGVKTGQALAKGELPDVEDTPLVDTLLKGAKTTDQVKRTEYFDMKKEITTRAKAYQEALKAGDDDEANRLMQKYAPEIGAHDVLTSFETQLQRINKTRADVTRDTGASDADRQRIMQELDDATKEIQTQANKAVGELLKQKR